MTAKTSSNKRNNRNIWLTIGACALIILLLVWLTMADFLGDTDVAAFATPLLRF